MARARVCRITRPQIAGDTIVAKEKRLPVQTVRRLNSPSPKIDFEDTMILNNKGPEVSPFRLIISTALLNEPVIACPKCGESFIHIVNVFVGMNHTFVSCEGDDATVIRSTKKSSRRGSRVTITFAGECRHQFSYALQFHKGTVGVELINCVDIPPGKFPSTLWRD